MKRQFETLQKIFVKYNKDIKKVVAWQQSKINKNYENMLIWYGTMDSYILVK